MEGAKSHFSGPSGKKNRDDFLNQTSGKVDNIIRIAFKKAALVLFLNSVFLSDQDSKLVPSFYLYSTSVEQKNKIGDSFILLSQIYPKDYYIGLVFIKDSKSNNYVPMSVHVARGVFDRSTDKVVPPDSIVSYKKVHPSNKKFFLKSKKKESMSETPKKAEGHGKK